jgi:hypothetical protein
MFPLNPLHLGPALLTVYPPLSSARSSFFLGAGEAARLPARSALIGGEAVAAHVARARKKRAHSPLRARSTAVTTRAHRPHTPPLARLGAPKERQLQVVGKGALPARFLSECFFTPSSFQPGPRRVSSISRPLEKACSRVTQAPRWKTRACAPATPPISRSKTRQHQVVGQGAFPACSLGQCLFTPSSFWRRARPPPARDLDIPARDSGQKKEVAASSSPPWTVAT